MITTPALRSNRARLRVHYAKSELHRFTVNGMDLSLPEDRQARTQRKLEADLDRAEVD